MSCVKVYHRVSLKRGILSPDYGLTTCHHGMGARVKVVGLRLGEGRKNDPKRYLVNSCLYNLRNVKLDEL